MPQHRTQNAANIAADFLTRCFAPGETVALFLRRENPAGIFQRIVPLERALAPRYLGWLAHENSIGANIYVAANPLRCGSRKRTKESIAACGICTLIWIPTARPISLRSAPPKRFPAKCSPLDIAR